MDSLPISRTEALDLLKSYTQTEADMNHYLESEAIMRALAKKLGANIEYWGMLGLLHDVDWACTRENWQEHCSKAEEILKNRNFSDEFITIVQSHAYGHDVIPKFRELKREKAVEYALACAETITGLIYAYALMRGRKISDMEVSGLKKKFKDKRFAENCNREIIKECEKLGLSLEEFFALSIDAMKDIKSDIGLI